MAGNSKAGSLLSKLAKNITAHDTVSEVHLQEELDQIVLFHHLSLDKSVFANREKIMQENIEEYEPQLLQIYSRFERFSYFNSLFGTDQIQTIFVAFLGYQLLEKDPDWLANISRKKFPELSLVKQVKREGPRTFVRNEEYVKKIKYPSELIDAVFMISLKQASERENSIISKTVIGYAGSNSEVISGYEIVKLYTENPETFLTDEDNERIQLMFNAAYPEFVKTKGWKFKERKTARDIYDCYIGLLGEEAQKNLLACVDKVYGVNGTLFKNYAYKKVSLAEWVAVTKDIWTYQNTVEFLENNSLPDNWEKTFFELERWLIRREKIEASRVAFQDKLNLMKVLQQTADNISREKKAKKTVDATKREKQLEEELVAIKGDLALSRTNYQISKQNQLVAEDTARILRIQLDEAHTLNKKYAAEIENLKNPQEAAEPTIVEEASDPLEQIELPKNIVLITGHPRFRNDVKNTLGWDVIDINKSELHKLSKADLIAYNANSNAHRIYYSLKEEHFEKLVYVRPGTNLKLLVQNVKRGWYEILQARKETESEQ